MCLQGKIDEMMIRANPQLYQKYITVSAKGGIILYIKLNNALYGLLKSPLLWYKKHRDDLDNMGFVVNPYDLCVANMDVNSSYMTITWHVDGLKEA